MRLGYEDTVANVLYEVLTLLKCFGNSGWLSIAPSKVSTVHYLHGKIGLRFYGKLSLQLLLVFLRNAAPPAVLPGANGGLTGPRF